MSRSLSAGVLAAAFLAPVSLLGILGRLDGVGRLGGIRGRWPLLALAARLEQSLAQALELLVLGVQRLEIGVRRLGGFDLGEHDLGIAQWRHLVEELTHLQRVEPPSLGKARIFENGEIELDLGDGLLFRGPWQCVCWRQLEGGRIEAPIFRLPDLEQGSLRACGEAHLRDP